jgi:uncharacterized protein (DUF697 family)/energy-coupling factor transporter ATP-binding protein EcfA2
MKLRNYLRGLLYPSRRAEELQAQLEELRRQTPVPVFWLFGKTQSGKTTLIKYLTGAEDAEIGAGFRPTTRYSRQYQFPSAEAPLLSFLDTRGLDEPGYDSAEDIARFHELAHVVIVTARVMDHAQERVLAHLQRIREDKPQRPIILTLTCLHEAYPQQQHPLPYPFGTAQEAEAVPEDLQRSLAAQRRRFAGLADVVVPLDITRPEEGFNEPNYGGEQFKQALIDILPAAYRQTLITVEETVRKLRTWHDRRALPYILSYSTLAGTAGAIPIPWLSLLVLPGIQSRMVYHLARLYGQPLEGKRFMELAGSLGLGLVMRQAVREVVKFIPGVGTLLGSALAASSTYALGRACCYYYSARLAGHVPPPEELRSLYERELRHAEQLWRKAPPTNHQPPAQPG